MRPPSGLDFGRDRRPGTQALDRRVGSDIDGVPLLRAQRLHRPGRLIPGALESGDALFGRLEVAGPGDGQRIGGDGRKSAEVAQLGHGRGEGRDGNERSGRQRGDGEEQGKSKPAHTKSPWAGGAVVDGGEKIGGKPLMVLPAALQFCMAGPASVLTEL